MGKLIIFDCDGTLVDSEVLAARVFTSYWATHGVHLTETEFKETFIGKGNEHPDCVEIFKKMPEHVVDEGDRLWDEALKENLQPVSGMIELVSSLKSNLSVGSNSSIGHVNRALKKTGLDRFFGENVFSSSFVPNPKPAPDLFLYISKAFKIEPRNCIVIEDSVSGVQAAQNAGMKVTHCELDPPRPSKPSAGRAPAEYVIPWAELIRRTLGIDPEICTCGSKMKVEDSVTDAEGITAMMVRMGLSATPPPLGKKARDPGELDYIFEQE